MSTLAHPHGSVHGKPILRQLTSLSSHSVCQTAIVASNVNFLPSFRPTQIKTCPDLLGPRDVGPKAGGPTHLAVLVIVNSLSSYNQHQQPYKPGGTSRRSKPKSGPPPRLGWLVIRPRKPFNGPIRQLAFACLLACFLLSRSRISSHLSPPRKSLLATRRLGSRPLLVDEQGLNIPCDDSYLLW